MHFNRNSLFLTIPILVTLLFSCGSESTVIKPNDLNAKFAFDGELPMSLAIPDKNHGGYIPPSIPQPPQVLQVSGGCSSVYMKWQEVPNADLYRISYRIQGGAEVTIDPLDYDWYFDYGEQRDFILTGLDEGQDYQVCVRAWNPDGMSGCNDGNLQDAYGWQPAVNSGTSELIPPSGFTLSSGGETLYMNWNRVACASNGYFIEIQIWQSGIYQGTEYQSKEQPAPGVNVVTHSYAGQMGKTYNVRVRPFDGGENTWTGFETINIVGPQIGLNSYSFAFECYQGDTYTPTQVLRITNEGYGTLQWQSSISGSIYGKVGITPGSGNLASGSSTNVSFNVNCSSAGSFTGSLRIYDQNYNIEKFVSLSLVVNEYEQILPLSGIDISTGSTHSCAIEEGGKVKCWGENLYGQLGNGSYSNSNTSVEVSNLYNAVSIAAGYAHSCAVLSNGTVKCWGLNNYGQLGNGSYTTYTTPQTVSGINNALSVKTGIYHTCAFIAGGAVKCWGRNNYGQLGRGNFTNSNIPVNVSNITNAVSIGAGSHHSCAILTGGSMRCWGYNFYGQLGNGNNTNQNAPVAVSGISSGISIGTGHEHTCVVLSGGSARCWGHNNYGQLGCGNYNDYNIPANVNISNGVSIRGGSNHTCAVQASGSARCWGYNNFGQLGNGTTVQSNTPVSVNISNVDLMGAGGYHTCAVLGDNSVNCWGNNYYGQLGDGTNNNSSNPVIVY